MKIKSLITFVGTNDGKKEKDGAILTVFKSLKFDELYLIWTGKSGESENDFSRIAEYVKSKIEQRQKNISVIIQKLEIENPIDHNEIYPKLLELCRSLPKSRDYTGAIASGTPAMQVCWILMAESGDFKIKLIRSNEPKFGREIITEIKLGTGLPRIKKLENKIRIIRKEIEKKLKPVEINIKNAKCKIDNKILSLTNIEFCYYLYFLKRADFGKEHLSVTNNMPGEIFIKEINDNYKKLYPESTRNFNEKTSFQSNVSKINKKIKELIDDSKIAEYYQIRSEGNRGKKSYFIGLKKGLIKIK